VPFDHLRKANAADLLYAQEELFALFLSWLYGLPGLMINKPTPQGLNGAWRHLSQWMLLAQQAGLPTPTYQMSDRESSDPWPESGCLALDTVIILNGECFGVPVPEHIREGCARFHKLDGTSLLGIDFTISGDGQWLFTGATPAPDLRLGGDPFLDALAIALQS
jgi:hypothetical protein